MGNLVSSMSNNVLVKVAVADLSIQWIGFAASWMLKTEKFYDLTGSSTFLYLTWASLIWSKRSSASPWFPRQIAQNTCVSIWALRLGTYLFSRVLKAGEDRRFRKAKSNPLTLFVFWTLQAAWVWISLWPTLNINTKQEDKPLNYVDYLGYGLWTTGFLIEVIADAQKSQFRSNPENQGKFIQSGLWSLSRHPNYLGEIMLWTGLFLPATNVMSGKEFISAISPLFITYLLTNVSGLPPLERYADKKWGEDVEYQQYKANTAKLIPYIW